MTSSRKPHQFAFALILSACTILPSSHAQEKGSRVAPRDIPIPKNATSVVIDQQQQEIRFDTVTQTKGVAEFYKPLMEKKGWKLGFDQVASIFINLHYSKAGMTIKINAKKKDIFKQTVSMTITGDGIAWDGEPQVKGQAQLPDSLPAEVEEFFQESQKSTRHPDQFAAFDFPLGNSGNTSRDGELELLEFETKDKVAEVIASYEKMLIPKGWKTAKSQQQGEVRQVRFEKNNLYLRIGLWPFTFTNNAGTFHGSKGAIEGTGLSWSDSQPSGNVPEKQVASAEKFLGKLSEDQKQLLIQRIKAKREAAFWPKEPVEETVDEPSAHEPTPAESESRAAPPKQTKSKKPAEIANVDKLNASITMNGKVHQLKHVVAFEGWWFDEKVPTVIISEKPLNLANVKAAINQDFDAQELALLNQRIGRYLKITVTDDKNPSLSGWADNLSFSASGSDGSQVQVSEGRIHGNVGMAKAEKLGPWTYQFAAEFNVAISPTN